MDGNRILAAVTSAIVAGAVTVVAAATANADTGRFRDRANDAPAAIDLRSVKVKNFKRVVVRARYDNLVDGRSGGWSVYFDTNKRRVGPEFGAGGGLSRGTDWKISRMRGWQYTGNPRSCPIEMKVNYRRDVSTFQVSRRCLDRPGRVRVSVVASKSRPDGSVRRDYAPRRHRFYDWVPRG